MQFQRLSRAWQVCSLLTAVLLITMAATANGHEFSGYFDVSGVHEQDDTVQVTLHLRLFNHADEDAKSVVIALVASSPDMTVRGSFQPVKRWKSHQFVEMNQEFTITKREYNEWMAAPAQPNLIIFYRDSAGNTWQKGALISRRPM